MAKKRLWTALLSFLVLLGSACTTSVLEKKFLGKNLNSTGLPYRQLTGSPNHHHWTHKHLKIDYDYTIDLMAKTITFKGEIRFAQKPEDTQLRSETVLLNIERCEFRVLFADGDKNIVSVEVFDIYPGTHIYDPVPFKKVLPYDEIYNYVFFGYFLYLYGT